MAELKIEVELVADCLVDGVIRKAGDKVVVPVSLADAFGKGRTITPEERAEIVARKEAEAKKAADKEAAAAREAVKESRAEAKAEAKAEPEKADKKKADA